MNKPLTNEHGWHQSVGNMKQHFGLGYHEKWPDEGMDPIVVDEIILYVEPLQSRAERAFKWRSYTCYRNPHRLMVVCPVCDKHVSYGRFHQHHQIHNHQEG